MNEERPIEKLLRRHAQQRRDEAGPPPELHPATRRLLQGEVARQYPQSRPERSGGFLDLLRGRWVYAVGCLAVVIAGAYLLRPSLPSAGDSSLGAKDKEMSLAQATIPEPAAARDALSRTAELKSESQDRLAPKPASRAIAPATTLAEPLPEPRTRAALAEADFKPAAETETALRKSVQLAEKPAPDVAVERLSPATARGGESPSLRVATPPPASVTVPALTGNKNASAELAGATALGETEKGRALALTPAPTPQSARAPASETLTRRSYAAREAGLDRDDRAAVSQSFANVAAPSATGKAKQSPPSTVLMNFRVEQSGDEVRVIDGDGSTYLGLVPAPALNQPVSTSRMEAAAATQPRRAQGDSYSRFAAPTQQSGQYLYAVRGTNVTLQQAVTFNWNFVPPSNAPAAANQAASNALQNQQPPWSNAAINGQVQINSGAQFELNAQPVGP